ncbi:MAG: hypothetical protein A2600_03810 [Candidatus Lambdaproteobacteria bacterium RIFOXYD1_FULL_56_27]|uniref:Uncharacterized protein n=1 Tax=Candidatus Lambdaproteobacteria bacterium RIFOXYD2_FULL_56_26 TaxID=1817773 RepID=A0A1F6H3C0_9PROT|nr:MAG: hypothetical protein A2557_07875 [Candidatus Lambdaproteobacteria bacterium RIFOXYD2_FULL_56_26]OGH09352.1 MAG: hypothetical protein A2600_03810 [Candidatus Lambdaproteobacteria bacterium RIFOXYD1_FULL_56_27]
MEPFFSDPRLGLQKTELLAKRRQGLKDWIDRQSDCPHKELLYQLGSLFYGGINSRRLEELEPPKLYQIALGSLEILKRAQHKPFETEIKPLDSGLFLVNLLCVDRKFLDDSLVEFLHRSSYQSPFFFNPLLRLTHDPQGQITGIHGAEGNLGEEPLYSLTAFGLPGFTATEVPGLTDKLETLLGQITQATEDFAPMRDKAQELAQRNQKKAGYEAVSALFGWMAEDNAIFLGTTQVYEIQLAQLEYEQLVQPLGLFRRPDLGRELLPQMVKWGQHFLRSSLKVSLFELSTRSPVHRPDRLQLVLTRQEDGDGRVMLSYFLILFTRQAIFSRADHIPLAQEKVRSVALTFAGSTASHRYKQSIELFTRFPKSELFRLDPAELLGLLDQVQFFNEYDRSRLFSYQDSSRGYLRFTFALSARLFSPEVFEEIEGRLAQVMGLSSEVRFYVTLGPNTYSHHAFYLPAGYPGPSGLDPLVLESWLDGLTQGWPEQLTQILASQQGLSALWSQKLAWAFPKSYMAQFSPLEALQDLPALETLGCTGLTQVEFRTGPRPGRFSLQVYLKTEVTLTQLIPHLHRMGLVILDENKFDLTLPDDQKVYLNHFHVEYPGLGAGDLERLKAKGEELLLAVLAGRAESDFLNGLLFGGGLDVKEIHLWILLRNYLQQIGFVMGRESINGVLLKHPALVGLLKDYFLAKFGPQEADLEPLEQLFLGRLNEVKTLREEQLFKQLFNLLQSAVRTNYFVPTPDTALAIKFRSSMIEALPLPKPLFEIFVQNPELEAIHLRGGRIARGGIRYSDRPDDFRTEVLGLMKTQMMKNVVIVPEGSKGGFVTKNRGLEPKAQAAEVKRQYQVFMNSLLSLTDNRQGETLVHPEGVRVWDEWDPYLVVAADKGTAHLSDTANEISTKRGFWLQDAFASGGSEGYDHKKMGITAKGAWESVKLHFLELGRDIQTQEFTAIGIGDMAGDVFGNGLLLSKKIKLVAAFNHAHIFLDPNPDPQASWAERKRLFELPGSSWKDYRADQISQGGGVFERNAKLIPLSAEVKQALGTDPDQLSGEGLIKVLLCAPVDLLWNGGIGTYVKSTQESHFQVGDLSNEAVRVDGKDLRALVVGEGGNLGFTQEGRVEYALKGGKINTDAIDNSAGVDTSDHEVNLKILIGQQIAAGRLQAGGPRLELLRSLTEEIAAQVVAHNKAQSQVLGMDQLRSQKNPQGFVKAIGALTQTGLLNRRTEHLSPDSLLLGLGEAGLAKPDLAVVLSYSKMALFKDLMAQPQLLAGPELVPLYLRYFPQPLQDRFDLSNPPHPLGREILGTLLVNQVLDQAGVTLLPRVEELTQATGPEVLVAYFVADRLFGLQALREEVHRSVGPLGQLEAYRLLVQVEEFLFLQVVGLLLLHQGKDLNWSLLGRYQEPVAQLQAQAVLSVRQGAMEPQVTALSALSVPIPLAQGLVGLSLQTQSLKVARYAQLLGLSLSAAGAVTQELEATFALSRLEEDLLALKLDTPWVVKQRAVLVRRCQGLSIQILQAAQGRRVGQPGSLGPYLTLKAGPLGAYQKELELYKKQPDSVLAAVAVLLGGLERLLEP